MAKIRHESRSIKITRQVCDEGPQDGRNNGQVYDCAFHPSLPILACGLNAGSIKIFRGRDSTTPFAEWTPDYQIQIDVEHRISCLAWNVDGGRLAAGCFDGTVALIRCDGDEDDDEDESVFQAKEHQLPVFAITWNRWNRNLLASRSRDDGDVQRIWTWNSNIDNDVDCQCCLLRSKFVCDFEWISSTRLAVCTREGTILIYENGRKVPVKRLHHPGVCRVHWHFALHYLISCSIDGSIKVWSKKRRKEISQTQLESRIYSVDCHGIRSGGSALIASGLEDGTVVVWHVTENRWRSLDGHCDAVVQLSFSPNGNYLATMDDEEKLLIWSTKDWVIVYEFTKELNVDWNRIQWNFTGTKLAISNKTNEILVAELKEA